MKLGYTIWITGWVFLAVGIGWLVWAILAKETVFIAESIVMIVVSPVWLKWGRDKIQKAVLKQLEDEQNESPAAKDEQ